MAGIERASGPRLPGRQATFPLTWGPVPADLDERAGWIAAHLAADRATAGLDMHVRALPPNLDPKTTTRATRGRDAVRELLNRRA